MGSEPSSHATRVGDADIASKQSIHTCQPTKSPTSAPISRCVPVVLGLIRVGVIVELTRVIAIASYMAGGTVSIRSAKPLNVLAA